MTVAGTIFTEVVFVGQIFVSVLITEIRERLTYSSVADTRSQMEWREYEGWMARADGVSEVASTQGVPLNFVQEAENR
jgi:hypothetical protein